VRLRVSVQQAVARTVGSQTLPVLLERVDRGAILGSRLDANVRTQVGGAVKVATLFAKDKKRAGEFRLFKNGLKLGQEGIARQIKPMQVRKFQGKPQEFALPLAKNPGIMVSGTKPGQRGFRRNHAQLLFQVLLQLLLLPFQLQNLAFQVSQLLLRIRRLALFGVLVHVKVIHCALCFLVSVWFREQTKPRKKKEH